MRDGDNSHIGIQPVSKRRLNCGVSFMIFMILSALILIVGESTSPYLSPMWLQVDRSAHHICTVRKPKQNAPSSNISSLLPRTIARASARICFSPTDRLPPAEAMLLSKLILASPASSCSANKPAARSASFNTTSSYWSNGSKFRLRVPLMSSGCEAFRDGKSEGRYLQYLMIGLTVWGMIVTFDRSTSRLMSLVLIPSK